MTTMATRERRHKQTWNHKAVPVAPRTRMCAPTLTNHAAGGTKLANELFGDATLKDTPACLMPMIMAYRVVLLGRTTFSFLLAGLVAGAHLSDICHWKSC